MHVPTKPNDIAVNGVHYIKGLATPRQAQYLVEQFCGRWRNKYLAFLSSTAKWHTT